MKNRMYLLLGLMTLVFSSHAGPLHIGYGTTFDNGGCWWEYGSHRQISTLFVLPLTINPGQMDSASRSVINLPPPATPIFRNLFMYRVDLRGMMGAETHCVTLSMRFGAPFSCDFDYDGTLDQVLVLTNQPGSRVISAAISGDVITFTFESSCLVPGQTTVDFALLSDRAPTTNQVTIVDAQTVSGTTTIVTRSVTAIVPLMPPLIGTGLTDPRFQGQLRNLFTNGSLNGLFNFRLQLYDAAKDGLPASEQIIQTTAVGDGLFTVPLSFDPSTYHETPRWLNVEVRPNGNANFVPLGPLLPIAPAPQSFYALSAGSVSALTPGQAVTTLNGLTDDVSLLAGNGILIQTQKNYLIISTQPGPSAIHAAPTAEIQVIEQKLNDELKRREAENAELKRRLEKLEKLVGVPE